MKGYKPEFVDENLIVNLPNINESLIGHALHKESLRDAIYLDYLHYTLVMNKKTKQLIYAASNLEQQNLKQTKRSRWSLDSRIPSDSQLQNSHYKNNHWDRGHMVRRATNSWGESRSEAQKGSDATMFYTNASFQHANFNQDEWLALENMFKNFQEDTNDRLSIFTGPIHMDYDRHYHREWHDSVRIPSGFFKVICFKNKEGNLETRAFVLFQDDEALRDKNGIKRGFKFRNHQVTIAEIERMTGLEFDEVMYNTNPLFFDENTKAKEELKVRNFPERILVEVENDLVNQQDDLRKNRILEESEQSIKIIAAMINPSGEENQKEWISLFNISNESVNLDAWYLQDRLARKLKLDGLEILSGESLKLNLRDYNNSIRLTNKGNSLTLFDANSNVMDSKVYTAQQTVQEDLAVVL